MSDPRTTDYERALADAANICAQAAVRLNQVDRATAEVLRYMEQKILALKDSNNA